MYFLHANFSSVIVVVINDASTLFILLYTATLNNPVKTRLLINDVFLYLKWDVLDGQSIVIYDAGLVLGRVTSLALDFTVSKLSTW